MRKTNKPDFKLTVAQDKARDLLISDALHCALGGGSRSGKTFLIVRQIIIRALKEPGSRHVIFRFRFNHLKASIIADTFPKVIKLCFPGLHRNYRLDRTDWYVTLPNGSEIWFAGLDDKDRTEKILGMEFATMYFNECSQIPYFSIVTAWSRLAQKTESLRLKNFYDFNPPSKKHWTYQLFVEKRDPIDRQPKDEATIGFYLINPVDNQDNLDPQYLKTLEGLPEKARNRFLYGRFADDTEGQLFTEECIAANRRLGQKGDDLPEWTRVVVAVDPSGCDGDEESRSDEIGITVCATGRDGHGYLLEDSSGKMAPEDWATVAVSAYERWGADCIVGETNYGGDMVRAVIQAHNSAIPYKAVTASRGKVVRAEPISALYDQGKIHHVGYFADLEDQLVSMLPSGYVGLKSPDRADSMIWGFTELFHGLTQTESERNWRRPPVKTAKRSATRYARRK